MRDANTCKNIKRRRQKVEHRQQNPKEKTIGFPADFKALVFVLGFLGNPEKVNAESGKNKDSDFLQQRNDFEMRIDEPRKKYRNISLKKNNDRCAENKAQCLRFPLFKAEFLLPSY